jgi:hypothetical protein
VGSGADSRRGCVGPGVDSSGGRECGRKRFGANTWEWAQTGATGRGRMGPGADFRRGWMGPGMDSRCGCVESGVDSSCARCCGREYRVRARAEGESGTTIVIETLVWARTGATSGAGLNERVLEWGRAHAATGVGV